MTMNKYVQFGPIMALFFCLQLSACATGDSYTADDRQQGSQGMSGKGMGRGGGGGGQRQGPPPMENNSQENDEAPPTEAFAACENKAEGDSVEFTLEDGKTIKATCKIIDDHLVAVPEEKQMRGRAG